MNESMKQNAPIDSIRLSKISDPKFAFGYAIMADGKVRLKEPTNAILNDLRSAIDFARCHIGETPFVSNVRITLMKKILFWKI